MKSSKERTFLAIYLGRKASMRKWEKLPPKVRKERMAAGMQAWMAWGLKNEKSIVHSGGPLGTTKKVSRKGTTSVSNALGAFVIVRAKSHSDAAKLFKNHPHFMIFPGDSVEIMEILPIPEM